MRALELIQDLYEAAEWADSVVWRTLLPAPAAAGDAKLRELLHHIHLVQNAHLSIWRGGPLEVRAIEEFPDLVSLARWGREIHQQIAKLLSKFDEARLDEKAPMPWQADIEKAVGTTVESPSYGHSFTQVAMHTAYHRGQVNMRLRDLGVEPTNVDFVYWVWMSRPVAQWPV